MSNAKQDSRFKKFLIRNDKSIVKALSIVVTALIMKIAVFGVFIIGLPLYWGLCLAMPYVCGERTGVALFGISSITLAIIGGILTLRFLGKMRWLISIQAAILSYFVTFAFDSIVGSILREDTPPAMQLLSGAVLVGALLVTVFTLERAGKWSLAISAPLVIIYLAGTPLLMEGPVKTARTSYENQQGLAEAKGLQFQVFTPGYVPSGFELIAINTIPAAGNLPPSYKLDYSTNKDSPFGREAMRLTVVEEQREEDSNRPEDCRSIGQIEKSAPCEVLGETAKGKVFYVSWSNDPGYASAYYELDGTLIEIGFYAKEVSKEEILKVFNSLQPGATAPK